jgi:outer membrane beta-barrel protein
VQKNHGMIFRSGVSSRLTIVVILTFGWIMIDPVHVQADSKSEKNQRVDIRKMKDDYWNEKSSYSLIQDRIYPKTKRIELSGYYGAVYSDPFLTITNAGVSLGYHFNEFYSLNLIGWRSFTESSTALTQLERESRASTNRNPHKYFLGAELAASVIYGKLSLLGSAILYFDLHLLGGVGLMSTQTGSYATPFLGVGQQIWFSKAVALRVDYRFMTFYEKLVDQDRGSPSFGQTKLYRFNFPNVFTAGLSFFFKI